MGEVAAADELDTKLCQVTNVAPNATLEQMATLFSFIGKVSNIRLFPTPENTAATAPNVKICFVEYEVAVNVRVAQHLTNTVFIDRALTVAPYYDKEIPDEKRALELAGAGGGGQSANIPSLPPHITNELVTENGVQVHKTTDPRLAQLGLPPYPNLPGSTDAAKVEEIRRTVLLGNLSLSANANNLLELFANIGEVKFLRMAGAEHGPNRFAYVELSDQASVVKALQYNGTLFQDKPLQIVHSNCAIQKPTPKSTNSGGRSLEEAMKKVNEAEPLISAALGKDRSRSRSRSRRRRRRSGSGGRSRRRSGSRSRRRRSRSRSKRRSRSRDRDRRRKSRERRRSRSRSRERKRREEEERRRREREKRHNRRRSRSREKDRPPRRSRDKRKVSKSPRPRSLSGSASPARGHQDPPPKPSSPPPHTNKGDVRKHSPSRSPSPLPAPPPGMVRASRRSPSPVRNKSPSPHRKSGRKKDKKKEKSRRGRSASRSQSPPAASRPRSRQKKNKKTDKDKDKDLDSSQTQVSRNYDEEEKWLYSDSDDDRAKGKGGRAKPPPSTPPPAPPPPPAGTKKARDNLESVDMEVDSDSSG